MTCAGSERAFGGGVCVLHAHMCVRLLAGLWQQVCLWACHCVWCSLCVCLGVSTRGRTCLGVFQYSRVKLTPSFTKGRGRGRNGLAHVLLLLVWKES